MIVENVPAPKDRIEVLLADEELRLRMGANGRRRVEGVLSWNHTRKNLALAYEALFADSSDSLAPHSLKGDVK
jgi:glycosyltransferase involved in cell wall biosynthesis